MSTTGPQYLLESGSASCQVALDDDPARACAGWSEETRVVTDRTARAMLIITTHPLSLLG